MTISRFKKLQKPKTLGHRHNCGLYPLRFLYYMMYLSEEIIM